MSAAAEALQTRSEVRKVADLLDRDPATLDYLEALSLEEIRALRRRVAAVLSEAHSATIGSLAAASRLLPTALAAALGQRVFGALLSARIASALEPDRAAGMAAKMDTTFVCDIAVNLDPGRTGAVLARIPGDRVADITGELSDRGDYLGMARLVIEMPDAVLGGAIARMHDRAVLEVAFAVEHEHELARLVRLLPEERVPGIIAAAARESLWVQAIDLLGRIERDDRDPYLDALAALDAVALAGLAETARDYGLTDEAALVAERVPGLTSLLEPAPPSRRRTSGQGQPGRAR